MPFYNVLQNHTIHVTFVAKSFTITATAGSGGTISPTGTTTVSFGGSQAYTITPLTGYVVQSVTVDNNSAGPLTSYIFSNVTMNHTIDATFIPAPSSSYIITAMAGSGGSITPSGTIRVNAGGSTYFYMSPNNGYEIADVKVDGNSVGTNPWYYFYNVNAKHSISVLFRVIPLRLYTITASAGTGGTITPSGVLYLMSGSSQTYTIRPNPGYKIYYVIVDGAMITPTSTVTLKVANGNRTITVYFMPVR